MQENENIVVMPFFRLTREMFPEYSRQQYRKAIKNMPMLAIDGKLYVNSCLSTSGLVFEFAKAMVEMTTQELRDWMKRTQDRYPDVKDISQVPAYADAKKKAELICLFLVPVELKRRQQILNKI